jgi:hypothetical protein
MAQLVGVKHDGAAAGERGRDSRFATRDAAGQADGFHVDQVQRSLLFGIIPV